MSDTLSVSNFYVDHNGVEQPIHYKAADLVNKLAPEGYQWTKGNEYRDFKDRQEKIAHEWGQSSYSYIPWTKPYSQYDYYIAVKKEEA